MLGALNLIRRCFRDKPGFMFRPISQTHGANISPLKANIAKRPRWRFVFAQVVSIRTEILIVHRICKKGLGVRPTLFDELHVDE